MWGTWEWRYSKDAVAVFYPYVAPQGFAGLLARNTSRRAGSATFRRQKCRIVRIMGYQYITHGEVAARVPDDRWDLWIREQDDVLVKAEHTVLNSHGVPMYPSGPDIVCVLETFDEDVQFDEGDFDPAPLVRRFSAAAAELAGETPQSEDVEHGSSGGF